MNIDTHFWYLVRIQIRIHISGPYGLLCPFNPNWQVFSVWQKYFFLFDFSVHIDNFEFLHPSVLDIKHNLNPDSYPNIRIRIPYLDAIFIRIANPNYVSVSYSDPDSVSGLCIRILYPDSILGFRLRIRNPDSLSSFHNLFKIKKKIWKKKFWRENSN